MDTEKRLALAFVLTMLILFAFQWYSMVTQPPQKPGRSQTASSSTPGSSSEIVGEATATPLLSSEDIPSATGPETNAAPVASGPWAWLSPQTETAPEAMPVVVESPLYRVTISPYGAIPTSWKLLKFEELFSDRRYLEMLVKTGATAEQQQAQLELEYMDRFGYKKGERSPVEAVDPSFHPGEAGLQILWGNGIEDRSILYSCSTPQVTVTEEKDIVFTYSKDGIRVEKIYHFFPDTYRVDLKVNIENQTGQTLELGGNGYYDIVWFGGFGLPSHRWDSVNNALIQREGSVTIEPIATLRNEIQSNRDFWLSGYDMPTVPVSGQQVGWVGVGQKYFMASIIPALRTDYAVKGISSGEGLAQSSVKPHTGVRMKMDSLRAGENRSDIFTLYVGPTDEDNLKVAQAGLEDAHQIFLKSLVGPIAQMMLYLLQGLYLIVPNYGVAIILLTLIVKLLMLPIYHKQMASMKKMQAIQPQINALKEQYKNDPQKLQKEQMELFRKHKVNPLAGCLPILVTIPIFIALYATFNMAVELRGAPFMGWIDDLSTPDRAFYIPLLGSVFTVNILPLAYAALMLWSTSQQKMEGPNAQAMKIMPIMMIFFFWSIASGVILYFVISIAIDTVQRLVMDKFQKGDALPAPAPLP